MGGENALYLFVTFGLPGVVLEPSLSAHTVRKAEVTGEGRAGVVLLKAHSVSLS